jgi:hypothetical protein
MTRRITVSLPDHVAERLDLEPNASAYVARAVEHEMSSEMTLRQLEAAGFRITAEGRARARAKLAKLDAQWPPERFTEIRELHRERSVQA